MARESEWRERVAEWRASGLSAKRFCSGKDYTTASLWQWSSRLGQSPSRGSGKTTRAMAAVPVARVVRDPLSSFRAGTVVVELHGARIEVQGTVEARTLRAVFEGLRETCPEGRP